MLIAIEVNWYEDVVDHIEWDDDAKALMDKIRDAEKDDEAMECIEQRFDGEAPEEGELRDYIVDDLLDDMEITESELDEIIRELNGEDEEEGGEEE